jgi:uncharacterized protein
MTTTLIIISSLCLILGFFGSILPALPGPSLSYLALVILQFSLATPPFSLGFLIVMGVITLVVMSLDYILPLLGARWYGASKYGIIGALIGMIIGMIFFPPFGMIAGILIGAICGELIIGRHYSQALRSGLASFIVSLSLMFVKFFYALLLTFFFVKALI